MLAEHEVGPLQPHVFGPHDLVGPPLLEHAVLVNAGLVRKGIAAHDRLVPRHLNAGDVRHQPAGRHQPLCDDAGVDVVVVAACLERHHDFFQGAVTGPFADPVDRALHLTGPRLHRRQTVGHGEAEVVVAVHADHRPVDVGHAFPQAFDHVMHLRRCGIAHGVGDVDGGRTGVDDRFHNAAEEVDLRSCGILGGKLHVTAIGASPPHARHGPRKHLVFIHPQLEFAVDRTRCQEDVNPRLGRMLERLPGPIDVGIIASRQPADRGRRDCFGNVADAGEVAGRGDRKAGLDDIHPQLHEGLGDLQFLGEVHARPGRLFAVAERGVEDPDRAC